MNPNQALWKKATSRGSQRACGKAAMSSFSSLERSRGSRYSTSGAATARRPCRRRNGEPTCWASTLPEIWSPRETHARKRRNAFAAAEQSGKSAQLQQELETLFERENRSTAKGSTSIPPLSSRSRWPFDI